MQEPKNVDLSLVRAWWLARQGQIDAHRRMLMRNFTLTSAAVLLRVYLFPAAGGRVPL